LTWIEVEADYQKTLVDLNEAKPSVILGTL